MVKRSRKPDSQISETKEEALKPIDWESMMIANPRDLLQNLCQGHGTALPTYEFLEKNEDAPRKGQPENLTGILHYNQHLLTLNKMRTNKKTACRQMADLMLQHVFPKEHKLIRNTERIVEKGDYIITTDSSWYDIKFEQYISSKIENINKNVIRLNDEEILECDEEYKNEKLKDLRCTKIELGKLKKTNNTIEQYLTVRKTLSNPWVKTLKQNCSSNEIKLTEELMLTINEEEPRPLSSNRKLGKNAMNEIISIEGNVDIQLKYNFLICLTKNEETVQVERELIKILRKGDILKKSKFELMMELESIAAGLYLELCKACMQKILDLDMVSEIKDNRPWHTTDDTIVEPRTKKEKKEHIPRVKKVKERIQRKPDPNSKTSIRKRMGITKRPGSNYGLASKNNQYSQENYRQNQNYGQVNSGGFMHGGLMLEGHNNQFGVQQMSNPTNCQPYWGDDMQNQQQNTNMNENNWNNQIIQNTGPQFSRNEPMMNQNTMPNQHMMNQNAMPNHHRMNQNTMPDFKPTRNQNSSSVNNGNSLRQAQETALNKMNHDEPLGKFEVVRKGEYSKKTDSDTVMIPLHQLKQLLGK